MREDRMGRGKGSNRKEIKGIGKQGSKRGKEGPG